ncbi:hypothetical protein ACFLS1_05020 [Verrucomicrobiota bacterium]
MQLAENQKQAVTQWVNKGCGLAELQKKLLKELGLTMTYMDVRFLVISLGLQVHDKHTKSTASANSSLSADAKSADFKPHPAEIHQDAAPGQPGGVVVDVNKITKPGTLISGTVKFNDGTSASWFLDQFGRLTLQQEKEDSRPSEQDIQAFQAELKQELAKRGF